jgi:hypothetical protein
LLQELLLSELVIWEVASVFVVSVDKVFHNDALLCWIGPDLG